MIRWINKFEYQYSNYLIDIFPLYERTFDNNYKYFYSHTNPYSIQHKDNFVATRKYEFLINSSMCLSFNFLLFCSPFELFTYISLTWFYTFMCLFLSYQPTSSLSWFYHLRISWATLVKDKIYVLLYSWNLRH